MKCHLVDFCVCKSKDFIKLRINMITSETKYGSGSLFESASSYESGSGYKSGYIKNTDLLNKSDQVTNLDLYPY
jgi:hypothetical protein